MSTETKPEHPARATYDANTKARQDAFLEAFVTAGNIRQAALAIGVNPQTVYQLWNADEKFQERLQVARNLHGDYLEQLAMQKLERLDSKDNMLHIVMLNGARPEKYRQGHQTNNDNRQVHITKVTYVSQASEQPEVTESRQVPAIDAEPQPQQQLPESATDTGAE